MGQIKDEPYRAVCLTVTLILTDL